MKMCDFVGKQETKQKANERQISVGQVQTRALKNKRSIEFLLLATSLRLAVTMLAYRAVSYSESIYISVELSAFSQR